MPNGVSSVQQKRASQDAGLALDEGGGDQRRVAREELATGDQDHEQTEGQPEQTEQELLKARVRRL